MVLVGSFCPSLKVHQSDHFVDVVHHLEWKLGCVERQRWLRVKIVRCFGCQRLELGDEGIHLIWNKCEVSEFIFSPFPGSRILKRDLEASGDFQPIMLVRCWPSCCELSNHPIGPAFGPVLDVWSFDEPQHECHALHRVDHLFCVDVGQAVKVELVDECIREGTIPIEIRRRVSPNFPFPPPPPAPPGGPLPPPGGLVPPPPPGGPVPLPPVGPPPPGGPVPPGGFPSGPLFPELGLVKNDCDWVGFLVPASVRAAAVNVCVIDMVCAKLCVMLVLEKELCVCPLASESSMSIPETFPMGRIDCLPSW